MSTANTPRTDDSDDDEENWIEANRAAIEREADSNAPDAWVFERLLQSLDDDEGGSS